eukprot:gene6648-4791_t
MGGGVSLIEGVEELMTTTLLIGRAISAMSFPGMYRLYDFHSKKAPKLRNAQQFTFFAPDSDDEDAEKDENEPNPADYEHFFKVTVNGDDIYLENPIAVNEAGWTPLHTCCMSMSTVSAGIAIVDETLRLGGSLECKTTFGPGTFNKGWTPLQMACGYGIDSLVEKLVEAGADVNATNCFGYSCLHEACHRGFHEVVKLLLQSGRVDLRYVPPDELAAGSPFASAPCQSPLAEAARCGFYKIVQQLLDAGAPKDLANRLGWTALHEACFYHRVETVKTLLLAGADPTLRTTRGALPYHLAGLPEIKQMLQNMGGAAAVPADDDLVDMIQVLTDLTLATELGASAAQQASASAASGTRHRLLTPAPRGADPKDATQKRKAKAQRAAEDAVPPDMPKHFLCQLTHKPMSEPVKTVYGNVYDRTAIVSWFAQQGRICPLTGLPLAEIDLTPQEALGSEIRSWILKRSLADANVAATATEIAAAPGDAKAASPLRASASAPAPDDLYDF